MPRINGTEGNAVGIGALWQGLKLECSTVAGQLSGERSAAANPKSGDLKLLSMAHFKHLSWMDQRTRNLSLLPLGSKKQIWPKPG